MKYIYIDNMNIFTNLNASSSCCFSAMGCKTRLWSRRWGKLVDPPGRRDRPCVPLGDLRVWICPDIGCRRRWTIPSQIWNLKLNCCHDRWDFSTTAAEIFWAVAAYHNFFITKRFFARHTALVVHVHPSCLMSKGIAVMLGVLRSARWVLYNTWVQTSVLH